MNVIRCLIFWKYNPSFTTILSNSMKNLSYNHYMLSSSIMFMFIRFLTCSSVTVKHKYYKSTFHSTFQNHSKTFDRISTIHKDLEISPWESRKGMLLYIWHVSFYEIILQFTKHCVTWTRHWSYIHFNQRRARRLFIKQASRNFETSFRSQARFKILISFFLAIKKGPKYV